jgi:hypothetical protein
MKLLIKIFVFFSLTAALYCRQDTKSDSIWNLQDLTPLDTLIETKPNLYKSSGWFPNPIPKSHYFSISFKFGDIYDITSGLYSKSFTPTKLPFTGDENLSSDNRKIRKALSVKSFFSSPSTSYGEMELSHHLSTGLNFLLKSSFSSGVLTSMLFSEDESRNYLGADGLKKSFKEVSIIELNEWYIQAGIGPVIPIYGGFLDVNDEIIASYYSITAKLSAQYSLWSSANQYYQIADAKDQLRYSSKSDTLRTLSEVKLTGLNRFRYGVDLSLSWDLNTQGGGMGLSFDSFIPLSSVINDGDWKQYKFALKWSILLGIKKNN